MNGLVHSIETFGASDGPGVRFIIFLKGCNMRCKYCHNPDTWSRKDAESMSVDELLAKAIRYREYWKNDGGITVSGGEPLLQMDFLIELFEKAKEMGINTTIDTSGNPFKREPEYLEKFDRLMRSTDLVMLDIKEINDQRHKELTGFSNSNILDMAKYLDEIGKDMWIRHVLVPENSDFDEDLDELNRFIKTLKHVTKVEILPYHVLGRYKWQELGIPYQLDDIEPPTEERILNAKKRLGII